MNVLVAILNVFTKVFGVIYEQYRKDKRHKERQKDQKALQKSPSGWFADHFSGRDAGVRHDRET